MRARTKKEQEFLQMRDTLPALTQRQRQWIRENAFEKNGLYLKRGEVWCQHCGYVDRISTGMLAVSLGVGSHVCPGCGSVLELQHALRQNPTREQRYVTTVSTHKGYTVLRTYMAIRMNPGKGKPTRWYEEEAYQNWIADDGTETILSHQYTRSPYSLTWKTEGKWKMSQHNERCSGYYIMEDMFNTHGNLFYPTARVTALLRRNGWRGELIKKLARTNIAEVMKRLLTEPFAEELVKTRQYEVMTYWMNHGCPPPRHTRWAHALRICNRNGYIVPDGDLWVDYIGMLTDMGKDTHNARYTCPADLRCEHDRLARKQEAIQEEERRKKEQAETQAQEADYAKQRGMFFGISFGDGNIRLSVISSVRDIEEEGRRMHHCVFVNRYYDAASHPDSLILSARDAENNRIETVEVNIRTWKVVQSRGPWNQPTAQHSAIVDLVEKKMGVLAAAWKGKNKESREENEKNNV